MSDQFTLEEQRKQQQLFHSVDATGKTREFQMMRDAYSREMDTMNRQEGVSGQIQTAYRNAEEHIHKKDLDKFRQQKNSALMKYQELTDSMQQGFLAEYDQLVNTDDIYSTEIVDAVKEVLRKKEGLFAALGDGKTQQDLLVELLLTFVPQKEFLLNPPSSNQKSLFAKYLDRFKKEPLGAIRDMMDETRSVEFPEQLKNPEVASKNFRSLYCDYRRLSILSKIYPKIGGNETAEEKQRQYEISVQGKALPAFREFLRLLEKMNGVACPMDAVANRSALHSYVAFTESSTAASFRQMMAAECQKQFARVTESQAEIRQRNETLLNLALVKRGQTYDPNRIYREYREAAAAEKQLKKPEEKKETVRYQDREVEVTSESVLVAKAVRRELKKAIASANFSRYRNHRFEKTDRKRMDKTISPAYFEREAKKEKQRLILLEERVKRLSSLAQKLENGREDFSQEENRLLSLEFYPEAQRTQTMEAEDALLSLYRKEEKQFETDYTNIKDEYIEEKEIPEEDRKLRNSRFSDASDPKYEDWKVEQLRKVFEKRENQKKVHTRLKERVKLERMIRESFKGSKKELEKMVDEAMALLDQEIENRAGQNVNFEEEIKRIKKERLAARRRVRGEHAKKMKGEELKIWAIDVQSVLSDYKDVFRYLTKEQIEEIKNDPKAMSEEEIRDYQNYPPLNAESDRVNLYLIPEEIEAYNRYVRSVRKELNNQRKKAKENEEQEKKERQVKEQQRADLEQKLADQQKKEEEERKELLKKQEIELEKERQKQEILAERTRKEERLRNLQKEILLGEKGKRAFACLELIRKFEEEVLQYQKWCSEEFGLYNSAFREELIQIRDQIGVARLQASQEAEREQEYAVITDAVKTIKETKDSDLITPELEEARKAASLALSCGQYLNKYGEQAGSDFYERAKDLASVRDLLSQLKEGYSAFIGDVIKRGSMDVLLQNYRRVSQAMQIIPELATDEEKKLCEAWEDMKKDRKYLPLRYLPKLLTAYRLLVPEEERDPELVRLYNENEQILKGYGIFGQDGSEAEWKEKQLLSDIREKEEKDRTQQEKERQEEEKERQFQQKMKEHTQNEQCLDELQKLSEGESMGSLFLQIEKLVQGSEVEAKAGEKPQQKAGRVLKHYNERLKPLQSAEKGLRSFIEKMEKLRGDHPDIFKAVDYSAVTKWQSVYDHLKQQQENVNRMIGKDQLRVVDAIIGIGERKADSLEKKESVTKEELDGFEETLKKVMSGPELYPQYKKAGAEAESMVKSRMERLSERMRLLQQSRTHQLMQKDITAMRSELVELQNSAVLLIEETKLTDVKSFRELSAKMSAVNDVISSGARLFREKYLLSDEESNLNMITDLAERIREQIRTAIVERADTLARKLCKETKMATSAIKGVPTDKELEELEILRDNLDALDYCIREEDLRTLLSDSLKETAESIHAAVDLIWEKFTVKQEAEEKELAAAEKTYISLMKMQEDCPQLLCQVIPDLTEENIKLCVELTEKLNAVPLSHLNHEDAEPLRKIYNSYRKKLGDFQERVMERQKEVERQQKLQDLRVAYSSIAGEAFEITGSDEAAVKRTSANCRKAEDMLHRLYDLINDTDYALLLNDSETDRMRIYAYINRLDAFIRGRKVVTNPV